MKKQISFRKTPKLLHSKTQIVVLGIICFFGILFFYYLLMMLRISVGISLNLMMSGDKTIVIPSKTNSSFNNFITAIFASIFGLSIFFKYLFRPIRQFKIKTSSYKKHGIISDTSVLFTGFYMIAVKSTFFAYLIFNGIFPKEMQLSENRYIWILFVIVLYLELWKTILLIYGRKALYKMILTAIIILPFSYGLTKSNLYSFSKMYKTHKENQVEYKYQITYPEAAFYKREDYYERRLVLNLNLGYRRGRTKDSFPNMIYRDKEIALKDLSKIISDFKEMAPSSRYSRITVKIKADKDLKMNYINQLKDTLFKYNLKKVAYKVIPKKPNSTYELDEYVIHKKISPKTDEIENKIKTFENNYKIHVYNKDSIRINDTLQKLNSLKIKNHLRTYTNKTILILTLDKNATYEDYIYVTSYFLEIYTDLRNEYCLQLNGYSYKEQIRRCRFNFRDEEERKKLYAIREKYPLQFFYDYFVN